MKKKVFIGLIMGGSLFMGLLSCTKDTYSNATLVVHLTDAPANYEQVLIDIQDVQIHASSIESEGGWQSLTVAKGVYNLLDFTNGLDTLLATATLPAGNISQMRLVLGSNNKIKINGEFFDLDTPSAQQSGLKFNINANLSEGIIYELWIDFDAARSIVQKGNGGYSLKPVIRTFNEAVTGAIKGTVLPVLASPVVRAIANGDTLSTFAGTDGKFLLNGVLPGTYKVVIEPKIPYAGKTVDNISVAIGQVTNMGTINLQ